MNEEKFTEELLKLPKEAIINYILKSPASWRWKESDLKDIVLQIKIEHNFKLQQKAIDRLNNHIPYEGNDRIKWLQNHQEWNALSKEVDRLFAAGEKLLNERRINNDN